MSDEKIRLTKRMALTGMYSRHEADKLVSNGYVKVNGNIAVAGEKVLLDGDEEILVNGVPLGVRNDAVYKFHKPRKVMSTYSDPTEKRNLSYFPELAAMKMGYSGRLDYDSEGLMLFTGNGDLIYRLQRSEFKVEKEYDIDTDCDITSAWLERLQNGIESNGETFLPCKIVKQSKCKYKVILIEGKKREVRRMFKAAGAVVTRLIRVRIGSVVLGNLAQGVLKQLTKYELEELNKCIESR